MEYYGRYKTRGTAIRIVETGELFDTRTQCADHLGVTVGMVTMCISGAVKSCRGYHIELVDVDLIHDLNEEIINDLYEMTGEECEWRMHPTRKNVYVSDTGLVVKNQRGRLVLKQQHENNSGYLLVSVGEQDSDSNKNSLVLVHRLVAETYIPNPENKPHVNHINGKKHDNVPSNLEWCTRSENMLHAFSHGLCHTEPVKIIETGEIFPSCVECARSIGGSSSGIHDCKTGRQKQHHGFHFEFLGGETDD